MRTTLSYTLAVDEFPVEAVDVLRDLGRDHGLKVEWKPTRHAESVLTLVGETVRGALSWDCQCSLVGMDGLGTCLNRPLREVTLGAIAALRDSLGREIAAADTAAKRARHAPRRGHMEELSLQLQAKCEAVELALSKLEEEWPEEPAAEGAKDGEDDE